MQVTLFNFKKRSNSTKRPTGGTSKIVQLKSNTSIYNPTFTFTDFQESYNYLKWGNRYYYIIDVSHVRNDVYEVFCTLDELATYKDDIKATSAYVLYSTSTYDTGVIDNRLSTEKNAEIHTSEAQLYNNVGSCATVSFIGGTASTGSFRHDGPVITAVLQDSGRGSGFYQLAQILNSNDFNDFLQTASKLLSDCKDAIRAIYQLPLEPLGNTFNCHLSNYTAQQFTAYEADTRHYTASINIPWVHSDFRRRSAFSSVQLYLPCYGWLSLNADDLAGKTSLNVSVTVSMVDGNVIYEVEKFATCKANIAVPLPIATTFNTGLIGAVGGAVGLAGSVASGNVLGTATSAFNVMTSALQRDIGSVGGIGSNLGFNGGKMILCVISHNTTVEPSTMASVYGRPLNQVKKLSDLTGYVQTVNASVNTNAPQQIKESINNKLNGGVYLE